MIIKNLKDLESVLKPIIEEVFDNEVATIVKEIEQQAVNDKVYEGYRTLNFGGQPWRYQRRKYHGGLQDIENMKHMTRHTGGNIELTVENVTEGSRENFRIDTLVEYGDGTDGKEYEWKENRDNTADQYLTPRPFTQETINDLKQWKEHVNALQKGMKARGYKLVRR